MIRAQSDIFLMKERENHSLPPQSQRSRRFFEILKNFRIFSSSSIPEPTPNQWEYGSCLPSFLLLLPTSRDLIGDSLSPPLPSFRLPSDVSREINCFVGTLTTQ